MIEGYEKAVIVAVDTDGTDGPTDVADGIVDGRTFDRLEEVGLNPSKDN